MLAMDHDIAGYQHAVISRIAIVTILLLGLLFSSLDASIVYTSLLTISLDLRDFVKAPWVVLSYLLAYIGFAIPFAKASDIWGRRWMLIWAWALFTIGSLGSGLATSIGQLIFFRAVQGVGGSGLYSLAQVGLFEIGPTHSPQLLGALISITLALSFVLGPVLGGTISSLVIWRWIFHINIPFGAMAILVLLLLWPKTVAAEPNNLSVWQILGRLDPPGIVLSIAASSLIVSWLATAGRGSRFLTFSVPLATLGFLSGLAFVVWEVWLGSDSTRFPATEPMIPLRLLRARVYIGASLCCWFTGWIYLSLLVILPERFQIVNKEGPLMAGVRLLPMLGTTALGSFLAGALCRKRNMTSTILIVAQFLQAIGVALFVTLRSADSEVKAQNGYQVVLGLGIGLSFGSATILTQVLTPGEYLAVGQGVVAQMRVFGGAIGIAVCSVVYNWKTDGKREHFNPKDIDLIKNNPVVQQFLPPELQALTRQNFVDSFNTDIIIILVVGLVGALFSFLVIDRTPPPMPFAAQGRHNKDVMGSAVELQSRDSREIFGPA